MKDVFGRAGGDVLTGIERAAHSGRRITARRARRDKRGQHTSRGWSIGSLTVTPVVAAIVVAVILAGAAGAAVALGGKHSTRKESAGVTPTKQVASPSSTRPLPPPAAAGADSIYVRYADAANVVHYMYCTNATGCGLLEVAKDGSSKIAIVPVAGVWHREERTVIQHDPCINIIQNAQRIGKPGDLVRVITTDLRRAGTQTIKGISAPARITGGVATRFEHPEVPDCKFTGFSNFTQPVDSPVTVYVPAGRSTARGSA